jgi:hypothetical protein
MIVDLPIARVDDPWRPIAAGNDEHVNRHERQRVEPVRRPAAQVREAVAKPSSSPRLSDARAGRAGRCVVP